MQIKGTDAAGGSKKNASKPINNTKKKKDKDEKKKSVVKPSQKKSDELTALIEEDKAAAKAENKIFGGSSGTFTVEDEDPEKRTKTRQNLTALADVLTGGTFGEVSRGTRAPAGDTSAKKFDTKKEPLMPPETGSKATSITARPVTDEKTRKKQESDRKTGRAVFNAGDLLRDAAEATVNFGKNDSTRNYLTYDENGRIDTTKTTPAQMRAAALAGDANVAQQQQWTAQRRAEDLIRNPYKHTQDEYGAAFEDVRKATEEYQKREGAYLDYVQPNRGPDVSAQTRAQERKIAERAPDVDDEKLWRLRADRETDEGRKAEYTARADAEKDVKASTKRIREAQDAVDRMLGDGNFYSEEAWTRAMDVLSEIDKGTYDLAGVYGAQEGIDEAKRAQIDKIYSDLRKRNQSLYEQADARRENASLWSDGGKTVKRALGESNRSNNVYGGLNSFASALNDAQLRNLAGNDVAYQEGLKAREVAKTGDIEKIDSYIKELEDRLTGIGRMSDEEAFEYDTRFPQQDNAPGVGGLLSAATRYKKQITDADILESGGIQFALGILDNEKWAIRQEKLNKLTQEQIDLIDAYNNDRHGERGSVFYTPSATMQIESMSRQSKESDALSAMNDDIKKRTGLDWWEAAKLKREVDEHTTAQDFRRDAEILAGSDLTEKEIAEGKKAVQSPLLAGILSIGANAIGGISSAVGMLDAALDPDTEFSQDSPFAALQQFGSTVRGAQSTQIKNDLSGFLQEKEFTKGFSDFMGGAAALGYSAAMSAVDSALARVATGGTSDILFGINAFTDKYAEAKANHSPTANAMITALGAGVFEALFEHLSLEQMKVFGQVTPKNGMDYVWNAVKAFTTEGSEELSTDLANTVWDIFVNGANSDHYQNVALYRLSGLSEKDAKRKAGWDLFWQYVQSFAAGGLAGAGESTVHTAIGGARYTWQNKTAYTNYIDTGSFFSSKRGNADVKAALKAPDALKYEGANQEEVRDTGAQMWNRILNTAEAASEMGLKDKNITALLADSERIRKGESPQTELKTARKYAIKLNQEIARKADIEYTQHLKDAFKTILTEQGAKSPDMLLEALANEVRNRRTDADGNTEGGAVGPEAYLIKTQTAQRALAEYERAVELDRGGDETNAALPAWYTRMKSRDSLSAFRSGAALGLYRLGVKQIDRSRLNVGEPGYVKADGTFVSATPTGVSNTDGYGKTILHMSDGTQVDMDNVTFADGDTAVIYKAAGDLPITAAKGLVEKWQAARERGTTTPAEVFASGYSRFFSTGRAGIAFETAEEASRDIERAIGQDAARMAHAQGENFRMNPAEMYVDMTADEAKVVTFGRGESATLYDADDPFYMDLREGVNYAPDVKQEGLTLDQKAQVYLVSAGLNAKKGRTPVVVHDTIFSGDNAELNGFYDKENNVLHVSLNAEGGLLLRTVAHEMAHYLKQSAPEAWNALRDYVVQTLKDTPMGKSTAYDKKMEQLEAAYTYKENGTRFLISNKAREGSREYIDALEEEMVSDSCFDVLGNEENVKEFAKQNLTGLKKIARWISDFLGRIRDAIKEISYNDAAVAALRKQTDKLERIRDLFEAAIRESEANRGAEATESGEATETDEEAETDEATESDETTENVASGETSFSRKATESAYEKEILRQVNEDGLINADQGIGKEIKDKESRLLKENFKRESDIATRIQDAFFDARYSGTFPYARVNALRQEQQEILRSSFDRKYDFLKQHTFFDINKDNFFNYTMAVFEERKSRPRRDPDYVSYNKRTGKISSEYWYTDKGVIRGSNHWGEGIRSCDWILSGKKMSTDGVTSAEKTYGFCAWDDFAYKLPSEHDEDGNAMIRILPATNNIGEIGADEDFEKGQTDTGIALIDTATESAAPSSINLSRKTWEDSEYVKEREKTIQAMLDSIPGVTREEVEKYINDIDNIAYMIAKDNERLDYKAAPGRSAFVTNVEYGGSIDFSTLCAKRALLTGTFSAIQRYLDNTVLKPEDVLKLRNMMKDEHYIVSCGLCYVEGSRAQMGEFSEKFIERFKQHYPDAEWVPNMYDVNTPEGVEDMRINHPDVYALYEKFWNNHGKLVESDKAIFASQQKPKLYQKRTAYNNELLDEFGGEKNKDKVRQKNRNGGIRIQSFSDFELPHMIDMMQVIMDMSRAGLKGQAYTKVPAFAWAFGNTGLKINLSLIAKGVDENGKLIYDDVEGMPHEEAFHIRDTFSRDVGTILVVFDDAQLKAAMADPQIDFIIPFHRSQWKKSQYDDLGLPKTTKDFTRYQNEKFIVPHYHEFRGRQVREKAANYPPNSYWRFDLSGKENAQIYLDMCAKDGRRPKFYELLDYHPDGRYSMKEDGSTDGYWKLLIDFKMYDNDGNGAEQMPVRPIFNMGGTGNAEMDAHSIPAALDAYKGGHDNFPVAKDVVKKFIEYKTGKTVSDEEVDDAIKRSKGRPRRTGEMKMSRKSAADRALDERYMAAVNAGDMKTAENMVRERAKAAGYTDDLFHGTKSFGFTRFDPKFSKDRISLFFTSSEKLAQTYSGVFGVRMLTEKGLSREDIKNMSGEELAAQLTLRSKELGSSETFEYRSAKSIKGLKREIDAELTVLADDLGKYLKDDEKFEDNLYYRATFNRLLERVQEYNNAPRSDQNRVKYNILDVLYEGRWLGEHDDDSINLRRFVDIYEKIDLREKLKNNNLNTTPDGVMVKKTGDPLQPDVSVFEYGGYRKTAIRDLSETMGNYALFGKPGRQLVIDGKGSGWAQLYGWQSQVPGLTDSFPPFEDIDFRIDYGRTLESASRLTMINKKTGETIFSDTVFLRGEETPEWLYDYVKNHGSWGEFGSFTRNIAQWAARNGYDSVKIANIMDDGGQGKERASLADVYIYFNGNNVKSADPVTYDDDGNVIPLSERFNTEKDDIRWSRQTDNKFLKTEIQESREKLDDAIDSMALGVKTNYEPAAKRADREERRTLMLNHKSAASQGVRMAEEAVAEILKTDTALKEALREAQRQTKLSKDIGYRLTAASVKRAADALTEAHPEITATKVAFASALSGLYKLMMDDRSLPGDEALELASQVAKTATGDPWGETTVAQHELAQEILGKYIDIGYQQTFGDKADEKISALKDKARKGIANEREKSRLKLAEARAEYKKKLKEQHSTDRGKYEERLGEYKEHHKEMMHKRIEQHAKSKRIEQIRKHVAELRRKLTSPTEKKHIPANMLKTVIAALDLFGELDSTAHGKAVKYALSDISDAYRDAIAKQIAAPNEELLEIIDNFKISLGEEERHIRQLSVDELEGLWKVIRAVEKYVSEQNKAHSEMLNRPISEMIEDLQHEISGKTVKPTRLNPDGKAARAKQTAKSLELRNLKPVYFFRRFASDTMEKLFWALQNSELGWERIAQEAQQAKWDADRAYDPNNKLWYERGTKPKTVTLELERGDKITLTALQAASLWLMAKDEGGATHLMQGGFIVDKPEYKKGSDGKYHPEVSDHNVRLTAEDFVTLGNALTEDQKAYATRLQKYLAGPLATHGNAVTQKLYELDRFTNRTYWPLRSAQEFLDSDPNNPARADTVSVRSPGFTKARIPHASNPVVLEDMFTVWARHVNGMALYASMTLPLDDMLKVWNTRNYAGENIDAQSVKMEIERRYGKEYVRYMEQFLRDINGGLRGDPSASFINSMLSHFKAAAVMGNVSVALQQPASVGRAMAYIDPKYLAVGAAKALRRRGKSFDEMQEHAPIGGLKSRGAFDVMISTGLNESLIEREDVKGRTAREWANTVLGYGAEFGDAATWTVMWEACKAQIKTQEGLTGDALLDKAAELFNKTMVLTQVYDSVFSRSELMRAKDTGVKEATAFMAEPTTSLNMIEDMIFQIKNGRMGRGQAARIFAGVMTSIILANAASALVGAVRKKDEEHSFWEKFLASFGSGVADDLTPISYIPVVKDIYSIFKGYGIDRSAYSGIATLYDTLTKVVNPDKRDPETLALLAGAMADLTGLPGTRLTKDIFAAARFAANLYNPDRPTFSAEGLWDAVKGEWTNPLTKTIEKQLEASRTAKLYRDYVNGSDDYEKRYEMYLDEGYTEDEIEKSLRAYYANQDKRTQQAKNLAEDGDISGYKALVEEMAADTGLSKSFIADAVLGYGKHVGDSIYTSSMVVNAFNEGSPDSAEILEAVIEARAQVYMAQGKDAEEALKDSMSAMRSAFTSYFKPLYIEAVNSGNTTEAERIRQIVIGSGVYADAEKAMSKWE